VWSLLIAGGPEPEQEEEEDGSGSAAQARRAAAAPAQGAAGRRLLLHHQPAAMAYVLSQLDSEFSLCFWFRCSIVLYACPLVLVFLPVHSSLSVVK
jgi:hypothetical protein